MREFGLYGLAAAVLLTLSCESLKTSHPAPAWETMGKAGKIMNLNCSYITGWVGNRPEVSVKAYVDGYYDPGVLIGIDTPTENPNSGVLGFKIPYLENLRDGQLHRIRVFESTAAGENELDNSPRTLNCPATK